MPTFRTSDAYTKSYFRTLLNGYKKQDIDCYALQLIKAIIDLSKEATPGFIIASIKSLTAVLQEITERDEEVTNQILKDMRPRL